MSRSMMHPGEVLVLGAGIAGSVVARRLCEGGARVTLIGAPGRAGIEGVSARARALLLEEGLDAGLLAGPVERRGAWGERPIEGVEWLVERERLAEALRARAVGSGVEYRLDPVRRLERDRRGWRVTLRSGVSWGATTVVEARGRGRSQAHGPALLALGGRFQLERMVEPATRLTAMDVGWCWWAQFDRSLWLQVVGSPRALGVRACIETVRHRVPALEQVLARASADSPMVACAAQARLGAVVATDSGRGSARPGLWVAGDAAVGLDPLSGQGIHQTLVSARRVATALLAGGDAWLTQRRLAALSVADFERCAEHAAAYYRENRGGFWQRSAAHYQALATALRSRRAASTGVVAQAAHPPSS